VSENGNKKYYMELFAADTAEICKEKGIAPLADTISTLKK